MTDRFMLQINLRSTAPVRLQSFCSGAGSLAGLAELLDTELQGGDFFAKILPNVLIEQWHSGCEDWPFAESLACAVKYDQSQRSFYFCPRNDIDVNNYLAARLAANYLQFAMISALLRGSKILTVHGAVLKVRDGVLLLIGEGGVGKSTSVRRWQAAGGTAIADDMFLIEYGSDDLWVHPMPTWSACAESMSGLCYPIQEHYPVKGVLCMARGEISEDVLPVSRAEFFTQIYSSCFFFNRRFTGMFKDERRVVIQQAVREAADILSDRFVPRALFAHLDGDLIKTLEEFL